MSFSLTTTCQHEVSAKMVPLLGGVRRKFVSTQKSMSQDELSSGYRIAREQGSLGQGEGEERVGQPESYAARARQNVSLPGDRTDSTYKEQLELSALERERLALSQRLQEVSAPEPPKKSSRWDKAPAELPEDLSSAPKRSRWDQTPNMVALASPAPSEQQQLPPSLAASRLVRQQWSERPFTDEELDFMLPSDGYEIVVLAHQSTPITTNNKMDLFAPPEAVVGGGNARVAVNRDAYGLDPQRPSSTLMTTSHLPPDLPAIKPEDVHYFGKLMEPLGDHPTREEETNRTIMILLLKIKNGLPLVRKQALRQITDDAPRLGAGPLFNQLLPLLMSPMLDEQERHLLVKVVDRVLFRLEDQVRPFAHKIFSIIAPLLIETDHYARLEGREIISNLAKACGLATMIATMRPDIDHPDEFVRNTTARALSIVASALGIQSMCPFLKAVCRTKKSWEARHTGIKVVQQISMLMGSGVLPHLNSLVECIAPGLQDEQQKIRTMTALALSSLAEAAHPYGFESFTSVLDALWDGIAKHRGKGLAAFIKCEACIIPLMDDGNAFASVQRLVPILIREFDTPEEDTKKIILKAVKQCASALGVSPQFCVTQCFPAFSLRFGFAATRWTKRTPKR
ncbi:hypothetical protein BASA81_000167 [Batrachochytrium salamandrivorans]|nr:hypothetical protein BASA81_000167 [Batrachochytrium salamandrivorans]